MALSARKGGGRPFGWHSGSMTCKDAYILGDLTIQDDIIFGDCSAGKLSVTGEINMENTTSAIGIDMGGTFATSAINIDGTATIGVDLGGTHSTVAINIDGTCNGASASAINIDLDYDFATIGSEYPSAIRLDLTQTSKYTDSTGGFYGVNSRLHAAYANLGTYCVLGRAYVTATGTSQKINDVVGIMGEIRLNGTDTKRYASTSSISAVRGSISNASTGAWDGQVFGLMLDFGANADFGDETALIFGYSHGDVKLDYGIHILSYSTAQALTTGFYLESTTGSTITTGIDIDGAGTITTGIDIGACTTGIVISAKCTTAGIQYGTLATPIAMTTTSTDHVVVSFSTTVPTDYSTGIYALHTTADDAPAGGVQGVIYGRTNVKHTIQDAYGMRGRMQFKPDTPAAESANMLVGVMASASLENAGFATTVADSIKGLDASVSQTATSTLTTGSIRAVYADVSGIKVNNAGRTAGVYIKAGGGSDSYPDYALHMHIESNNNLAAAHIETKTSCVCPIGIYFNVASGSITNAFKFSSATTAPVSAATGAVGNTTNKIAIDIAGATRYLVVYDNVAA